MTFRRHLVAFIKCRLKSFSSVIYQLRLGAKEEKYKDHSEPIKHFCQNTQANSILYVTQILATELFLAWSHGLVPRHFLLENTVRITFHD